MEFAFIVWAIGTLPSIGSGLCAIGAMGSIAILVVQLISFVEGFGGKFIRYLAITLPMFAIGAVIPDKETAYAMAAAYGVQSVAENERVQKIAGQGIDVLESYLEKTKKEFDEKK